VTIDPIPVARSTWECQMFFGLAVCPQCGETGLDPVELNVGQVWEYATTCPNCEHRQQFAFAVARLGPPPFPAFGGAEPSQLIDAGQFLVLAEEAADDVPADPADLSSDDLMPEEALEELSVAVAAIEEVLKFIPADADRVPREALWTVEGLARFDADPVAFDRRQLIAMLGAVKLSLAAYSRL